MFQRFRIEEPNNRTELTAASVLVFEREGAMRAPVFSAAVGHPARWAATRNVPF